MYFLPRLYKDLNSFIKLFYPKADGKILLEMGSNITDVALFKFLADTIFFGGFFSRKIRNLRWCSLESSNLKFWFKSSTMFLWLYAHQFL